LRRDPGLAFLITALLLAAALYAPTLGRGLVNYDDLWLVRDNFLLHEGVLDAAPSIFFDTSSTTRFVLGAEYLPVRDLSIVLDHAVWGDWYPGYHLTNLGLYLGAILVWFAALTTLGLERRLTGLAILLWAIHPSHAESVAWVSERKGLLALLFCGLVMWGYARFRAGGKAPWLVLSLLAAVAAIWSKAPSAITIAALVGFELVLPDRRVSWRRSLAGLGAIAAIAILAFIPVVLTALNLAVVASTDRAPGGPVATSLGLHGFYLELAAMAFRNAVSYPIATQGPSLLQIALGTLGLAACLAAIVIPGRGWFRPPRPIRVGSVLWLAG